MRLSRVLIAGAAVATAGIATSAFTASNNFGTVDNNVAGYGELVATGVSVTNIAYNPAVTDAAKLHSVVFTVGSNTSSMAARMTLYSGAAVPAGSESTCVSSSGAGGVAPFIVTCTMAADLLFTAFDKTGLTVTSN